MTFLILHLIIFPKLLCKRINIAICAGVFPDYLKRAIITPIWKSGDKKCVHNYRPISVLPFISKFVEKCLLTRLVIFLDKPSIISLHHYVFIKGRSTHLGLIAFTAHVYKALDNRQLSFSVFFSIVEHSIPQTRRYF